MSKVVVEKHASSSPTEESPRSFPTAYTQIPTIIDDQLIEVFKHSSRAVIIIEVLPL